MSKVLICFMVCLTAFSILAVEAREQEDVNSSAPVNESAPVLRTPQGKLIRDLFRQSEKLHSIVLAVTDDTTFKAYEKELELLGKSLGETLAKLAELDPLDEGEQIRIREELKKEETRIMAIAEKASQHVAGLNNVLLSQRIQRKQTEFLEQIGPAISKQSARHYKPRKATR